MELFITASVNAGISLHWGAHQVWCERSARHSGTWAVHPDTGTLPASAGTPGLSGSGAAFFHTLPSRSLFQSTGAGSPAALAQLLFGTSGAAGNRADPAAGGKPRLRLGTDLVIRFRRLPHEGRQYAAVPHYGAILEREGFRILLAGDCAIAAQELADFVDGASIDLAVLPFPGSHCPEDGPL